MFKSLIKIIKRGALGLATSQLISGYRNKKTFRQQLDDAQGLDKLKVIRDYLLTTNKDILHNNTIDELVDTVKKNTSKISNQINNKIEGSKLKKTIQSTSNKAKNTFDDIMIAVHEKLNTIEGELSDFESKSLTYGKETWIEYYRQLASKFALFEKTALKHISQGVFAAEEQFNLEQKIKYMSEKLEELKKSVK